MSNAAVKLKRQEVFTARALLRRVSSSAQPPPDSWDTVCVAVNSLRWKIEILKGQFEADERGSDEKKNAGNVAQRYE